ncbi:hypothetical protein C2L64_45460 [Paraburkholderia hospita]|uniref:Uncharacterized protein n=1 Tax=Paraburkholderia hospita TaxID=169430 RepID=A0AAN1JK98_9BURK|nr:hypothetical protein [Paraburkholderia hospita]AUT75613.1 hypothetical protein C2L64_45460 [Paraburkholderia hospita]
MNKQNDLSTHRFDRANAEFNKFDFPGEVGERFDWVPSDEGNVWSRWVQIERFTGIFPDGENPIRNFTFVVRFGDAADVVEVALAEPLVADQKSNEAGKLQEVHGFLAGNPNFSYYAFSADGYLIAAFDRSDDATTYVERDPRLRVLTRAEVAQQFPRQYQEALYERESAEGKVPEATARQENRESGKSARAISREIHKRLFARYLGSLTLGDAKQILEAIERCWREQMNGNMGSQLKADDKKVQAVNVAVEHMLAHELNYIDDILAEAGFRSDSLAIAANSSARTLDM